MSGIYIHDMEMPNKKKTLTIFPDGRIYEHNGNRLWGRGKDCIPWKAISVSNHGRLIDANEMFIEFVTEGQKTTRYKIGEKWELNGEEIRRVIQRLPTIIPADEG